MWVINCSGQLTLLELHAAVALRSHHRSYADLSNGIDQAFVSGFEDHCRHLFHIGTGGLVFLAHQSVKEMLLRRTEPSSKQNRDVLRSFRVSTAEAHLIIARQCFTLMEFAEFSKAQAQNTLITKKVLRRCRVAEGQEILSKSLEQFPMLEYAFRHWPLHYGLSDRTHLVDELCAFLKTWEADYFRIAASLWANGEIQLLPDQFGDIIFGTPPISHLMQRGDFPEAVHKLIVQGQDLNEVDETGTAPLYWAIMRDRPRSFELLAREDLEPNRGKVGHDKAIHYCIRWKRNTYLHRLIGDPRVDFNVSGAENSTPLHTALKVGNAAAAEMLLDAPAIDILARDKAGSTPLDIAFQKGHGQLAAKRMVRMVEITYVPKISPSTWGWSDIEEEILDIDPSRTLEVEGDGMSVLTRYAYYGRREKVEMILRKLKPDALSLKTNWGTYNLVHLCAHQDWEETVQILIEKFCLDSLDGDHVGRTLLHWAVENCWKYGLIDHWKKPRSWLDKQDRDGMTALHLAVLYRNIEAVKNLVEQGVNILLGDKYGRNAVHLAAECGFRGALKVFMIQNTREFGRDHAGASLLHYLAMWQEGDLVTRFLYRKRFRINVRDKKRRTPLHFASMYGNTSSAKDLLWLGADLALKDCHGQTALHIALQDGNLSLVKILLSYGADYYESDSFNQNALHLAIRGGDLPTIQYILEKVQFVRDRDRLGRTALHRACELNDALLISKLLELGSNVNQIDKLSQTPLHIAVVKKKVHAVASLIRAPGVNVSKLDYLGCTPRDRAKADGNYVIESILLAYGAENTTNYLWKLRGYVPLVSMNADYVWPDWPIVKYGARQTSTPDFSNNYRSHNQDQKSKGSPQPDIPIPKQTRNPSPSAGQRAKADADKRMETERQVKREPDLRKQRQTREEESKPGFRDKLRGYMTGRKP